MTTNRTTTGPTETSFYANHTDAQLEAVAAKSAADGMYIATNHGADHPLALEHAKIWAAATGALLARAADLPTDTGFFGHTDACFSDGCSPKAGCQII